MESSKNIKELFYIIFPQMKGKELKPDIISEYFSNLISSNSKDYFLINIHLYFYPSEKSSEKNSDINFWFEKYKISDCYTEFNFALDLLEILYKYLDNKDVNSAKNAIEKKVEKFEQYKNIDYYLLLTRGYFQDILVHIYSFFHKDIIYFKVMFSVDIKETDDLTNVETLENLFCGKTITKKEIKTHRYYIKMMKRLNDKINSLENQKDMNNVEKVSLLQEFNKRDTLINDNKKKINELAVKLNQIYVRDIIKYSIKYIYRVFYSQFGQKKEIKNKTYDQIIELKEIFKKPEFSKFDFLYEFLCAIEFGDLTILNQITHPALEIRNFDDIKLYIDNNKPYLNKVVAFLKGLPDISKYINLELTFYLNKKMLEEKISKNYDFNSIYNNIFSH